MSDLTKEQYEQLPDFVRDDYTEVDGVYKHAGMMKVKGTLNDLDSRLKSKDSEFNALNERLTQFEQTKAQEIEQARAEALEQAKSKGEVESIEQLYQEQMADLEKRTEQRVRSEVEQEYTIKEVNNKAQIELTELVHGLKPKDDFAKRLIQDHLKNRQKVEDGKIIYLNEDGSASSLDKAGLLKELQESPMFKPLTSYTPPSQGGGNMNGTNGGSAPTGTPKTLEECKGDRKLEALYFNSQLQG